MFLLDCYLFFRFCTVWDKGKLLVLCKVLRAFCLESWLGFCGPLLLLSLSFYFYILAIPTHFQFPREAYVSYVILFLDFPEASLTTPS